LSLFVRAAALSEVIDRLPHGLDTRLGELGEGLSGGEWQWLGLACAFLREAPLPAFCAETAGNRA
ncbi:MAG: hypothetical protein RR772_09160, partial [Gordonibacter sp.]